MTFELFNKDDTLEIDAEFYLLIAPFHPGYSHTLLGALISTFWMFLYGYIFGAVFALIYNSITKE